MKIVNMFRSIYIKIKVALSLNSAVYYINGPEKLPEPLTPQEEAALLENYDTNDVKVREILITRNLRLVVYIAKKFDSTNTSIEDMISIGTIGLIKAVNTFRPDKNIKLATYASRCIENEILMYLRKFSSIKNEISIDEPLNVDWDGNELLLSDVLGSEPDEIYVYIENESEKLILKNLVKRLCDRERTIMELRFGLSDNTELTQKEVADKLGISQSYISRLEKRIIEKLRTEIKALV